MGPGWEAGAREAAGLAAWVRAEEAGGGWEERAREVKAVWATEEQVELGSEAGAREEWGWEA